MLRWKYHDTPSYTPVAFYLYNLYASLRRPRHERTAAVISSCDGRHKMCMAAAAHRTADSKDTPLAPSGTIHSKITLQWNLGRTKRKPEVTVAQLSEFQIKETWHDKFPAQALRRFVIVSPYRKKRTKHEGKGRKTNKIKKTQQNVCLFKLFITFANVILKTIFFTLDETNAYWRFEAFACEGRRFFRFVRYFAFL